MQPSAEKFSLFLYLHSFFLPHSQHNVFLFSLPRSLSPPTLQDTVVEREPKLESPGFTPLHLHYCVHAQYLCSDINSESNDCVLNGRRCFQFQTQGCLSFTHDVSSFPFPFSWPYTAKKPLTTESMISNNAYLMHNQCILKYTLF